MGAQPDRAARIFDAAVELGTPAERAAYLHAACGPDLQLRAEVEELLAHDDAAGSFLNLPARPDPPATADAPSVSERPGTVIGPYKLLQEIGEGGMGTVFMAEQQHPVRRKVALKVIKPGMDSRQVIARFEAERQALAMMDHVNIARVLDAGTTEAGLPYFVMELVHGVPITKYCDDNQLTPRERLELFVPVCQAIQHAHQKGIIHRDIKPSNVLVTLYDGKPVPKVIDFGVAKATEQKLTERTLFTQYGTMVGTFEYMSPEQAEMSALGADTRSDIYSLGVLLYELLTGSTPLSHKRVREAAYAEILRMIKEEEPPRPSTRLSDSGETLESISAQRHMEPAKLTKLVRGELDWIVMKCLEKDRSRRYETASALARDVEHYLHDEPVQACPPSALYRFRKFARRNKAALVTGSVLVLAALLVVGVVAGSLGWMAHEQTVRQGILTHEVDFALQEAAAAGDRALTLTDNPYQWEAALAAAFSALKRAEGLAAQEKARLEPAVHDRLDALRAHLGADENDRRFVARFDEIQLEQSEFHIEVGKYKLEIAFPAFKEAFQTHYAILFGSTAPEEVLSFLDKRPRPIREYLVAALEVSLTYVPRHDPQAKPWLAAVLQAADSDPWRKRVRAAVEARDWQALDKLVKEGIAARQPPVVLIALAGKIPWEDPRMPDLRRHIRDAYPGDYWANQTLANVLHYRQKPRLEEAIRYYTAAIAVRPRNPASYVDLGNAFRSKGELDEALAAYRRAIDIAPDYSWAHRHVGSLLKAKGDRDGARAAYQKSVDVARDRAEAYFQLGFILHKEKDLDGAIAAWRETIRLKPSNPWAYNNIGITLLLQGRGDEAIAAYREAVRLEPDNARYLNNLAWLLATCPDAKLRDPKRAVELAKKAVELVPKDGNQWNTLGVAHYRAGRWTDAVAALDKSMELSKCRSSFDFFFLAMAHWQLGDNDQSRKWYDQAVTWMDKNQPKDDELRRFRAEAAELLGVKEKKK